MYIIVIKYNIIYSYAKGMFYNKKDKIDKNNKDIEGDKNEGV